MGGAGAARATGRLVVVARGGEARAAGLDRGDELALGVGAILPIVDEDLRVELGEARTAPASPRSSATALATSAPSS